VTEETANAAAERTRAAGLRQRRGGRRAEAVSVDIYDQIYHLRGTDPAHIERLAALVDERCARLRPMAAPSTRCACRCWRR